jgi:cellulose synthase/poly-beta-1,6-N-acetylglucosamine synthase-like glycosyltransferase
VNQQLTIVIPSKNEGKGVIDVIKLILSQINCRIIVADSSTEESSILLLKKYQSIYKNIEIIKGGLPAVARNNGAKLVKTPYILFLDADIFPEKNTIRKCIRVAIKDNYDLVTCKFKTDKKYNWVYRIFDIIQWFSSKTKPFALGGFMLFKTETFNKLKGFYEEDKVAEDYHLSSKVKPNRFKITNNFAYTSSRRFNKKGIWYMIKLAWKSWLNINNNEFFKQDFNYWK